MLNILNKNANKKGKNNISQLYSWTKSILAIISN